MAPICKTHREKKIKQKQNKTNKKNPQKSAFYDVEKSLDMGMVSEFRRNNLSVSPPPISVRLQNPEGVLSPKLYVDVPATPGKFDFLYTNFSHNYPPISVPFLKENHPILLKLSAFYHNLLKIHQFI